MNTLKQILGIGSFLTAGLVLSQVNCGDSTVTQTPDMATPAADLATPPADLTTFAAPTITGISPGSIANTGGAITVTGTGFLSGATVTVGGVGCTSPTVTVTTIICAAPARAATCGNQPVVVTNPDLQTATDTKSLLYRSATLGFAAMTNTTVGAGANGIVAGDFNKDGKLDLAVTNRSANTVSLLAGAGDGSFAVTTPISALSGPVGIDVGDMSGD